MRNVYCGIEEYREELRELIKQLERDMGSMPEGRLRTAIKENRVNYYHCKSGKGTSGIQGTYLGKKNERTIRKLAQKDYLQRLIREVTTQLTMIDDCPQNIGRDYLINVYEDMPEYRKRYVEPIVKPESAGVAEWLAMPYEPKGFGEGEPEIYTENKERVRSKSEKLIADKLKLMGIPYKYECPIKLAGYGIVYPDFTILNKHTMEVVWLEHCGKMADPEYTTKMVAKIHSYERTGIYVGKNLYLTFETLLAPFDAGCLETIFRQFA